MGRRSLPAISGRIDYSNYLVSVDDLPCPLQAAQLFGEPGPLEVEVGCGKGLFIRNAAAAHPNRFYLGIEVAHKYAKFVAARLAQNKNSNARIARGDALVVFRDKLADQSVDEIHVYFPDPWWKARHRRRRIMNQEFLTQAMRVLIPGGRFQFWTDVPEYFDTSLQLIADTTSLEGPLAVREEPAFHDLDYRTHYERRVRLNQLPVFRAEFRKPMWLAEFLAGIGQPRPLE